MGYYDQLQLTSIPIVQLHWLSCEILIFTPDETRVVDGSGGFETAKFPISILIV
jgi:hypothetical protein